MMDAIGPYRVKEKLGSGGFGTVYHCVHEYLEDHCAVKVLHDASRIEKIVQEARNVRRLDHPNIVTLQHLDHTADPPYVVFEYVEGRDLRRRLLDDGPLEWEDAVKIMAAVLEGLQHAHERGVVHRDIKPSNILLSEGGEVKLSDFGLGHAAHRHLIEQSMQSASMEPQEDINSRASMGGDGSGREAFGTGAGTILYMSPQQQRDEDPDHADDIFAAGVVLYELLTGEPLTNGYRPASKLCPLAPDSIDAVISQGLAYELEDRYASSAEMRTILLKVAGIGDTADFTDEAMSGNKPDVLVNGDRQLEASPELWAVPGDHVGQEIIGPDGGVLVWVPGGNFEMGSQEGHEDEMPVHSVALDGFWIGRCQVTNEQFVAFLNETMPNDVSKWLDIENEYCGIKVERGRHVARSGWEQQPVLLVTWYGARAYCEHYGLQLPTEVQWEYAARGPDKSTFPWGDMWDAWKCCCSDVSSLGTDRYPPTSNVASHRDGASWCGALNMAGNVYEWCADRYDKDYYVVAPSENPLGPSWGSSRVLRGGSWNSMLRHCRAASRYYSDPSKACEHYGFRVARS